MPGTLRRVPGHDVVGLDISETSLGYCVIRPGCTGEMGSIQPKTKGFDRIDYLVKKVSEIVPDKALVVFEAFASAARFRAHDLGMLSGCIRYELWKRGIVMQGVAPSSLKKFVLGNGKGEKNVMLLNIFKKWGVTAENDDQADAFALARVGVALVNPAVARHQYEREVLAVITAEKKKTKKRKKKTELAEAA